MKTSSKTRILNFLSKQEGTNTFTEAQARSWFNIQNVTARISDLRKEGYAIYLNTRKRADGTLKSYYRLGKPSKSFKKQCRMNGVQPKVV